MKPILCLNCNKKIESPSEHQKFCCDKCGMEFRRRNKLQENPIIALKEICCVRYCKEKAVGICNKKYYCNYHYSPAKQKQIKKWRKENVK